MRNTKLRNQYGGLPIYEGGTCKKIIATIQLLPNIINTLNEVSGFHIMGNISTGDIFEFLNLFFLFYI